MLRKNKNIYAYAGTLEPLYNADKDDNSKQPKKEQFVRKRVIQNNQYQEDPNYYQKSYKRKQLYEIQSQESVTTPNYILQNYSQYLTKYEREEILLYKRIFYFGQNCPNKCNTIFTNQKGEYQPAPKDHIAYRYELLKLIGYGSFGQVYKAFDHKKQHIVALKTLKNTEQCQKQGKIEIEMLKKVRQILSYGQFRNHIYFTMPELYQDTYALMGQYNYKGIPEQIYLQISKDCMQGLQQLKQCQIISADIKPENILLKSPNSYQVQIIDIGTGCFVGNQIFYRAPEVILDVWSMGCTFAEFIIGEPLFEGQDQIDQFGKIVEVLGMPSKEYIEQSPKKEQFFKKQNNQYFLKSNHISNSRSLDTILKGACKEYIQLIKSMLQYEPEKRLDPMIFNWNQHFQGFGELEVEKEETIYLPQLIQKQDIISTFLHQQYFIQVFQILYFIGLGLTVDSISLRALKALKQCKKIFLDAYTSILGNYEEMADMLRRELNEPNIIQCTREMLENDVDKLILKPALTENMAILVAGDIYAATLHSAVFLRAVKMGVKCQNIHNASIVNAVSATGLEIYKFGRSISVPFFENDRVSCRSFLLKMLQNYNLGMHSLMLLDIKTHEIDWQLYARTGKEVFLPPRYMLSDLCCQNIIDAVNDVMTRYDEIQKDKQIEEEYDKYELQEIQQIHDLIIESEFDLDKVQAIACERVGTDTQKFVRASIREMAQLHDQMGSPLHSVVIVGKGMSEIEDQITELWKVQ